MAVGGRRVGVDIQPPELEKKDNDYQKQTMTTAKMINVNPVGAPALEEQIKIQRLTGSTLNVFGPSGVGKTTIMSVAAARYYDEVWLTNGAGKGPIEFTGLGMPERRDNILQMDFSQPEGIPTIERVGNRHIYWLLDEFGNWDPEVRASYHGVLAPPDGKHRKLGTHTIGPNVHIGLTSNRRSDGAAVGRFSIPEMMRGTIVTFIPDPGDWWEWAERVPGYAETFVPAFIAYGNSAGAVAEHKNHFLGKPTDFDPLTPNPLPNPRSWEEVMKLLALQKDHGISKQGVAVFIQGRVGDKATNALRAFLSVMEGAPTFAAMKADPKGFTVPTGVANQFMLASGAMLFATRGITDIPVSLHKGEFDWVFEGMSRFTPEVAAYGLTAAEHRGIKASERRPELWAELIG